MIASAVVTLIAVALLTGCSSHGEAAATSASSSPSQTVQSGAGSSPEAKIHIDYGSERDYLSSLTVTKYPAAYALDKGAYRLSEVQYGVVPRHFVQSTPDSGPPEPLEPNHYYIFSVMRVSGSTNYEAIKVEADGSLEGYDAEPRAGTSFRLCCNVNADFPGTAPVPTPSPTDSNGPNSNNPGSHGP
jgi:hypothetical protein